MRATSAPSRSTEWGEPVGGTLGPLDQQLVNQHSMGAGKNVTVIVTKRVVAMPSMKTSTTMSVSATKGKAAYRLAHHR
jgi:hypothetical protein